MKPSATLEGSEPNPQFVLQPALEGSLVRLRPIIESDFEALYAIASDPLLWEQHPVKNRTDQVVFRRWFDDAMAGCALVVLERSTGLTIGTSRYHLVNEQQREVEIGWTFLARSHWGGAYNGEVKRLMIEHAFGWTQVITLKVLENNLRSRRAVEKLGAHASASNPRGTERAAASSTR